MTEGSARATRDLATAELRSILSDVPGVTTSLPSRVSVGAGATGSARMSATTSSPPSTSSKPAANGGPRSCSLRRPRSTASRRLPNAARTHHLVRSRRTASRSCLRAAGHGLPRSTRARRAVRPLLHRLRPAPATGHGVLEVHPGSAPRRSLSTYTGTATRPATSRIVADAVARRSWPATSTRRGTDLQRRRRVAGDRSTRPGDPRRDPGRTDPDADEPRTEGRCPRDRGGPAASGAHAGLASDRIRGGRSARPGCRGRADARLRTSHKCSRIRPPRSDRVPAATSRTDPDRLVPHA